ncbi:MAG: hypothetical protein J7L37_04430 [Thermococcus sp.]|nr:hypothetical protein [Thermococcus sp.]
MHRLNALILVLVLLGTLVSGCTSPSDATLTKSSSETPENASSITSHVKSTEITGTFSGLLTAPESVFEDAQRLLEEINVTLYAFEVKVVGREVNASITISALKLVPPFVPENFSVTINGKPLEGAVYVPYAEKIPVSIETAQRDRGEANTTSYLVVKPQKVLRVEGMWDAERLNEVNGSTIMRNSELELRVLVRAPGYYIFTILCNGTEVSSGGLQVG